MMPKHLSIYNVLRAKVSYNLIAIKRCLPQLKIEMIAGAAHNLINENDGYWQQVSALLSKAHLNLPISNAINL